MGDFKEYGTFDFLCRIILPSLSMLHSVLATND